MKFDLFLKTYRKIHHLEQKEMAHRLGITRVHYARLEGSNRKPSIELLDKISSSLGIDAVDVLKSRNGDTVDSDVKELFEHVMMMEEKDRKRILSLARKISGGRIKLRG